LPLTLILGAGERPSDRAGCTGSGAQEQIPVPTRARQASAMEWFRVPVPRGSLGKFLTLTREAPCVYLGCCWLRPHSA
jgi:hypothetical protein